MGKNSLEELRRLIVASGRKYLAIAAEAEVHRDTIRNFLTGKTTPTRTTIARLAQVVGVAQATLIGESSSANQDGYALRAQLPPCQLLVGREEYLRSYHNSVHSGARVVAMFGMPGVGKTALAISLGRDLSENYPDAQLFIDMQGTTGSPKDAITAMREVIGSIYPLVKLPDNVAQVRAMFAAALNARRVLVIADDAASLSQIEGLFPPERSLLIVTSRIRLGLPHLGTAVIQSLSDDSAVQLLSKFAPGDSRALSKIAKLLGCLPLALTIAGGALAENPTIRPAEFARRLSRLRGPIRELDRHRPAGTTGIEKAIAMSEVLLSADCRSAWRKLSIFDGDFDGIAARALAELDGSRTTDVLSELVRRNLIEWREGVCRYRIHDVLRAFCRGRLAPRDARALRSKAANYFFRFMCKLDEDYESGGSPMRRALAAYGSDRHHILSSLAWIRDNPADVGVVGMLSQIHTEFHCFGLREQAADRARWAKIVADVAARARLNKPYALMLGIQGYATLDMGDTVKAGTVLQRCYDVCHRMRDLRLRAFASNFLGTAIERAGAPNRAIRYHRRALELARMAGSRLERWRALVSLGNASHECGRYCDGMAFYKASLRDACRLKHLRLRASSIGGIANSCFELDKIARAERLYREWRRLSRRLGDKGGEVRAIAGLGACAYKDGRLSAAKRLQELQIEIAAELRLPRIRAHGLRALGDTYAALDKFNKAEAYYIEALRVAEEIHDKHSQAHAQWKLGQMLEKRSQLALAIDLMKKSVDYDRRISHPDYANHDRHLKALMSRVRKTERPRPRQRRGGPRALIRNQRKA